MRLRNCIAGAPLLGALTLFLASFCFMAAPASAVQINEIRIDNVGADVDEYVEFIGANNESLAGLTYLVIGDGATASGTIEFVLDLGALSLNGSGFLVIAEDTFTLGTADVVTDLNFENSDNVTHMIVSGFTGANGDDLDTNDDCAFDVTPWTSIVDSIALVETFDIPASGECVYGADTVGPDGTFVPAHVFRCPGGFLIGDFTVGVNDTPGVANQCLVPPTADNTIHRPLLPIPGEAALVSTEAADQDGTVTGVSLFYRVDGAFLFTQVAMVDNAGSWEATIPGQVNGAFVEYYVEATDNDGGTGTNPSDAPTTLFDYTVAPETITPIADIHANLGALTGTVVQIQGQVYCPGDYRNDGNVSGYVQDASGRGINLFGTNFSTGFTDLNNTGNIVKITGTVAVFFTTVEIVSYEVELISSGNPPLSPAVQASTLAAAAASNEGTYIEASGVISDIDSSSATATNVTITDCSGPVIIRIDADVVAQPVPYVVGQQLTASGAGANFGGQGQILVCSASEISAGGITGDVCPPVLLTADISGASEITLGWDEAIDPVTGGTTGNYSVFETATPANTVSVTAANVAGTDVVLTLGSALSAGVAYTVCAENVEDTAGNAQAAQECLPVFDPAAPELVRINEIMQNPFVLSDTDGEWFEIYNAGASTVDIEGWTIQDAGGESHVIASGGALNVAAGAYAVLARNGAALVAEGITALYTYAGITLGNSADEVILLNASLQEVDRVEYDGGTLWPDPSGQSMQFDETQADNNIGANWSGTGAPLFGTGDRGTPGSMNDTTTPAPPTVISANKLFGNYPNPFNPITTFRFTLKDREHVALRVFNLRGQLVRTVVEDVLEAGLHDGYAWNGLDEAGKQVTSGTYFFRLVTASGYEETMKMVLIK